MVKARRFVVVNKFEGELQTGNLVEEEEELEELQHGEFLVEALFLSVDPYMRAYAPEVGQTMIGTQVAKVTESKNEEYPNDTLVVGSFGWRTRTVVGAAALAEQRVLRVPRLGDLPPSLALGLLGWPGIAAHFGLLDVCKPHSGDTVVVSTAAGAVGGIAGQIAKIKGCTVIGITGSDETAEWLQSVGFDRAINHKTVSDLAAALKEAAPNGIDCYFDNVGGQLSSTVLYQMNTHGRVAICDCISAYNASEIPTATSVQLAIVKNQLTIQGFLTSACAERWMEGIEQNLKWIQDEKLHYKETVIEGFENMPKALIAVLKGANVGQTIVKLKPKDLSEKSSVDFKSLLSTFQSLEKR